MSREKWVRLAYCRDIPLREGRAMKVGNREIAIFNLGDRFLAVENRCPHKGGPLADGIVSGTTVVCPLHGWKMSLETGKGAGGPSAPSCVESFSLRVEDGIVLLRESDIRGTPEESPDNMVICAEETGAIADYSSTAEA